VLTRQAIEIHPTPEADRLLEALTSGSAKTPAK
jgi:hypothetical protein